VLPRGRETERSHKGVMDKVPEKKTRNERGEKALRKSEDKSDKESTSKRAHRKIKKEKADDMKALDGSKETESREHLVGKRNNIGLKSCGGGGAAS